MLKVKYLHRKSRYSAISQTWETKKYKRQNIDIFSDDNPTHQPIRTKYNYSNYDITPLRQFIKSKIGQNWNDVYSEILSKIKKKYRYTIDCSIKYHLIEFPIYDDSFIPRNKYGHILHDQIFIDKDNIVTKKSKEEILLESEKYIRREKLKQILEHIEKEAKK